MACRMCTGTSERVRSVKCMELCAVGGGVLYITIISFGAKTDLNGAKKIWETFLHVR